VNRDAFAGNSAQKLEGAEADEQADHGDNAASVSDERESDGVLHVQLHAADVHEDGEVGQMVAGADGLRVVMRLYTAARLRPRAVRSYRSVPPHTRRVRQVLILNVICIVRIFPTVNWTSIEHPSI
jgi:hypothetical protein